MKAIKHLHRTLAIMAVLALASRGGAADGQPYKIVNTAQMMGSGGIDYVYADNDARRVYVPRGDAVLVFDEDTLKSVGSIPDTHAHGVAVDPKSHRGFSSSGPVAMWDTKTLEKIKTIDVKGRPDAIFFEPLTERVYVFSHATPNATILDGKDGSIVGTIDDLGGAPEQAASDEKGHLYVALEDKDQVAVVDVKTMKVTAHYGLDGKGGGPAGLGLDAKNHILFAFCHEPATAVVLNADDGKVLAALPIGSGNDSGGFNPATMEAFSSQRDGTLTIIKENSPTSFAVEQTVKTKPGAKTCTLDSKNNHVILITLERPATSSGAAPATTTPASQRGARNNGPAMLDIMVVGR